MKQKGKARVWEITLNWTTIKTPIFMPVWTKASIKGLILDLLQDPKYVWEKIEPIKLILANTFHLYLRPWSKIIQAAWGLHNFENWKDGLILTDSWWFQVFSLWLANQKFNDEKHNHKVWMKLTEEGVKFTYDKYEISCGADGILDCTIPYDKIKSYMQNDIKHCLPKWILFSNIER